MTSLHITDKDTDVRSLLLMVYSKTIQGFFSPNVVVHVHSSTRDEVVKQCEYVGRTTPPFQIFIYKNHKLASVYGSCVKRPTKRESDECTLPQKRLRYQ